MDRDRLQQVQQADVTESRVNQEFVDWLKTKGLSWLLAILIGLCAYTFIVQYRQKKAVRRAQAWVDLSEAALPLSKLDVADEYDDIFGVPQMAYLQAAEQLMRAVQRRQPIGANDDPSQPITTTLTDDERVDYLDRARRNYQAVVDGDDGELPGALYAVNALNGLAAVAEAQEDMDNARQWYERAGERADEHYPQLAVRARLRAESIAELAQPRALINQADAITAAGTPEERTPVTIDGLLDGFIFPGDAAGDDTIDG